MQALRNYTVQHVHIQCSYEMAWAYLNEPMNQKEWGVHFYEDIRKEGDTYIAKLPFGELPMTLSSHVKTGSISLRFGEGETIPSWLIKSSGDSCLYVFTLFQPAGMPDLVWKQQGIPNMEEELQVLKNILENKAKTVKA